MPLQSLSTETLSRLTLFNPHNNSNKNNNNNNNMGCSTSKDSAAATPNNSTANGVSKKKAAPQDQSDQFEKTPVNFILNLTDDKPLDASDVTDLNAAKTEIQYIRKFAAEFLATIEDTNDEQKEDELLRGAL